MALPYNFEKKYSFSQENYPQINSNYLRTAIFNVFAQDKFVNETDGKISFSSNNTLVNADYGELGSTSYSSIAYASLNNALYNDFTLDSNGRDNISKTSISKFGSVSTWDLNSSFGGTWVSEAVSLFYSKSADNTGRTDDPKLVVTYWIPYDSHSIL